MKQPVTIPIVPFGPGSHPPEDAELDYMPMPRGMSTFEMPQVPEDADAANMALACEIVEAFVAAMKAARERGAPVPHVDLGGVPAGALEVLNQSLGEGEVAIRLQGGRDVRIQETVFAGVWRERHLDADGTLLRDMLQAAPIPAIAVEAARAAGGPAPGFTPFPPGAMNAPALLHEIRAQVRDRRPQGPPHVLNLTLLPLTPDDHACLEQAIPVGPVAIMSRGFGNCRITSTGVRDVWRVQYFNNMQTLILNTLEVVDVPEVALAADEDLADSEERLVELLGWMRESAAA
jgi:hydrogenase-1 operon protein HyaF